MVGAPRWLALDVTALDRALSFYEDVLDLDRADGEADGGRDRTADERTELALSVGDAELRLRAPGPVPRGGVHTHYAVSVPAAEYDDWYARLDEDFSLTERRFGDARSLYLFDPDGHCVELGESDVSGPGVDGLFEVVLEVEDLERSLSFYRTLGFEVTDRGTERRRARLTTGDVDLELWEPRLGIADGRGGVHVDWGVTDEDASATARRVAEAALAVEAVEDGVRVRDPDGHYLTLCDG